MPEQGKTVVRETGKRGLRPTGKAGVYDDQGECPECCCQEKVIAQTITNSQNRVWDLTPYQGMHIGTPGAFWRLIDLGSCYPGNYPWYGAGCIDEDGVLVGLPPSFTGSSYNGYMYLQQGCEFEDDYGFILIQWPKLGCQEQTPRNQFPC